MDVKDIDAARAHECHELVVLLLGTLDPEHVVKQQLIMVVRREPLNARRSLAGKVVFSFG